MGKQGIPEIHLLCQQLVDVFKGKTFLYLQFTNWIMNSGKWKIHWVNNFLFLQWKRVVNPNEEKNSNKRHNTNINLVGKKTNIYNAGDSNLTHKNGLQFSFKQILFSWIYLTFPLNFSQVCIQRITIFLNWSENEMENCSRKVIYSMSIFDGNSWGIFQSPLRREDGHSRYLLTWISKSGWNVSLPQGHLRSRNFQVS